MLNAAEKTMSMKILLLSGSGHRDGLPQASERILHRIFEPTAFAADIVTVTTGKGAMSALTNDDFDVAIVSANIRQTYLVATSLPAGLEIVRFARHARQRNFHTPIILTSGDGEAIARYASPSNGIYTAPTSAFLTCMAAAAVLNAVLVGPRRRTLIQAPPPAWKHLVG